LPEFDDAVLLSSTQPAAPAAQLEDAAKAGATGATDNAASDMATADAAERRRALVVMLLFWLQTLQCDRD
jgi:hypothetical protein